MNGLARIELLCTTSDAVHHRLDYSPNRASGRKHGIAQLKASVSSKMRRTRRAGETLKTQKFEFRYITEIDGDCGEEDVAVGNRGRG